MSAAATTSAALGTKAAANEPPKVSAWKNLRGLFPYLRRYKGGIALGLFALALMGVVGNVVPLATGIIIDVLAGSPRPFSNGAIGQFPSTLHIAGTPWGFTACYWWDSSH
jgi:hypothetical protein